MTSQADWPTYNGQIGGNRWSALDQIDKSNVTRLAPQWIYSLAAASRLQVTPAVVDGVMYVTPANECHALDAGTGRKIRDYRRPRTKRLASDAAGGINRGVAVAGDRVFMATDRAHIIALDRFTGTLLIWLASGEVLEPLALPLHALSRALATAPDLTLVPRGA